MAGTRPRAKPVAGHAHGRPFVAREVVHDDDVTRAQLVCQDLGDVGFEPVAIDRHVKHHGRDHSGHAQAGDQHCGFAVPVREAHPQPLALRAAAVAAGRVGGGPGLVDEHEALRIEIGLALEPALPLPQDIGPVLLDRVPDLFWA